MPLSGSDVIFPLAFSGMEHGRDLLFHDTHSEAEWNSFYPCFYGLQEKQFPLIGTFAGFRYFTFLGFDAGALGLGTNVIPSGSIIDDVKIEVEVKDPVPEGINPTDDVILDAALVDRDGVWNSVTSGYGWGRCDRDVGAELLGENRAPTVVLRLSGVNVVRPIGHANIDEIWSPIRRSPINDERTALDSCGAVFTSTTNESVNQILFRLRRSGSVVGTYRFEIWSVSGADDTPDALLAYSDEATCNSLSLSNAGSIVTRTLVAPATLALTSGSKYLVCYNSSRTSSPSQLGGAQLGAYVSIQTKDVDVAWTIGQGCVALSGVGYYEGYQHHWSRAGYVVRHALPSLYGYGNTTIDVAPYGGFIASGLSGTTFGAADGEWVQLSGANSSYLVSAVQAWINDASYTTSGEGARLSLQLVGSTFVGSPLTLLSGARMLVSWSAPPNDPPTAAFVANLGDRKEPLTVAFDASTSTDPEGGVLLYSWDFGDGSPVASGVTTSHTYSQGSFIATLTVTDDVGQQDSATLSFTVVADRDWFDARGVQDWVAARGSQDWHSSRGTQDWHSSRGTQDWHSSRGSRGWFDSWED